MTFWINLHLICLFFRPNFYKSADTNAEKEAFLCQTEELADNSEEAVPPHASDATQPHSPLSTNLNHEEPVCYSVEAVLGPQLSRPFPSFCTAPRSQELSPLSSSDFTSGSVNQSQVPYSVDAVLRSCKSVENSTFGHTPTPLTPQTVSYTPKTDYEEVTDPLLRSKTSNERVLYSVDARNEANKPQEKWFKSLSSLQVHTGVISKTCPVLTLASGDHTKQGGNMPESPKPTQRASHEIFFSKPLIQTSTSKHPTQLKPRLSVLTSDSQASFKPFCPSSGFTEFKGRAAVRVQPVTSSIKSSDSANSVSCNFEAKPTTEIHLHSKKTQSSLKLGTENVSAETTAERSSKMSHCGGLTVGCKKNLKRPFHSLFASPITETLQPIDDSVTSSSCPQGLIQSSCPAPQSTDCKNNCDKTTLGPDKVSARSFLSLFAAPLTTGPLPCMPSQPDFSRTSSCSQQSIQSVDNASHLPGSKQRASNLEMPLPRQVRTDVKEISHAPRFPISSPNPKIGNENRSPEHINQRSKQPVNPICSLVSESLSEMSTSPSPTHAHQQLCNVSSHKGKDMTHTAHEY